MTTTPDTYPRRVRELAASDPELQLLAPDPEVLDALGAPDLTLAEVIEIALAGYADRPALAARAYRIGADPLVGTACREFEARFETLSYRELRERVHALSVSLRDHPVHRIHDGEFVGTFGFASVDHTVVDLALVFAHAVAVPLQSSLATLDVDRVLADTEPATLAVTASDLGLAARLAGRHASVRSIVAFDLDEQVQDDADQLEAARSELAANGSGAELVSLSELIAFGRADEWRPRPVDDDRSAALSLTVHSSGSTGTPKGAMYPERIARFQYLPGAARLPVVRLIYAPMNHFMGGRSCTRRWPAEAPPTSRRAPTFSRCSRTSASPVPPNCRSSHGSWT